MQVTSTCAKNKKSSWGFDYGYTDLSLAFALIKQKQDYSKVPAYHNLDANFRIKTSKTGMLKYYGYFSSNKLAFTTNSIDSLGLPGQICYQQYKLLSQPILEREPGQRDGRSCIGISYTNNKDDITGGMQNNNKTDVVLGGLEFKKFAC